MSKPDVPMGHTPQPEPLLFRGTVTTLVAAILGLLVAFGLELPAGLDEAILVILVSVSGIVTAVWGRRVVTPLISPKNMDGEDLVPVALFNPEADDPAPFNPVGGTEPYDHELDAAEDDDDDDDPWHFPQDITETY